jgi:hypothetical protein
VQLYPGRNQWEEFSGDRLRSVRIEYDGGERLELTFRSRGDTSCRVHLDWSEEIVAMRRLLEELQRQGARDSKLYPDDCRGLMIRGRFTPEGFELTFLKNYEVLQVVMPAAHAMWFLEAVSKALAGPGHYTVEW